MASFTGKSTFVQESKERMIQPKDFLPKDREPTSDDYDAAGIKFFEAVFGSKLDDADKFQSVVRKYCDTVKKAGKDGKEYIDASFFGNYGRRALGAVYGDGNFGGLMFTLAGAFGTKVRREKLAGLWSNALGTVTKPKAKARA